MQYREYEPCPQLAPCVSLLWTLEGHALEMDGCAQPVLPDGQPELVLHLGDPFERLGADGRATRQPMALFAGQLTGQLLLQPTGRIAVLGVRFRPFGAAALLPMSQRELTGHTPGVDSLSPSLARALNELRSDTDDVYTAVGRVQRILLRHADHSIVDSRIRAAVGAIHRTAGIVTMDDLAERASMTRRHLERRFLDLVGITPKRLARITRFQRALRVLETAEPARRGTETAATCGYADQPHFIRDFRELAGCSPAQHLLRNAELTGFFINDPSRPASRPSRVF